MFHLFPLTSVLQIGCEKDGHDSSETIYLQGFIPDFSGGKVVAKPTAAIICNVKTKK